MRAYVPGYDLRTPSTLPEALQLMAGGGWTAIAGGTDLMVQLEAGRLDARQLVSLWALKELKGIQVTADAVEIGALATYTDVLQNDVLRQEFDLLCHASAETGALAIRNRGTIGGNLANASPGADTPPALLCYDAELELVSAAGTRRLPYAQFHVGYRKTALAPGELIRAVRLARPKRPRQSFYRKVGTRKAQAISKVVFAGLAELDAGGKIALARVAVGSVAPVTIRCAATEAALAGMRPDAALAAAARAVIEREVTPIDDLRSTAEFRTHVTGNLLAQFVAGLR